MAVGPSGIVFLCVVLLLSKSVGPHPEAQCRGGVTRVYVDRTKGLDCGGVGVSLANETCDDLQDVLRSISNLTTTEPFGCIEVTVSPGIYLINSNITIENQSLILRGIENVVVTFNFSDSFDPTETFQPFYVIQLAYMEYAEISGIDFYSSPGIIGLESIATVVVVGCSFRLVPFLVLRAYLIQLLLRRSGY